MSKALFASQWKMKGKREDEIWNRINIGAKHGSPRERIKRTAHDEFGRYLGAQAERKWNKILG